MDDSKGRAFVRLEGATSTCAMAFVVSQLRVHPVCPVKRLVVNTGTAEACSRTCSWPVQGNAYRTGRRFDLFGEQLGL
jgi:hypothetical protein